MRYIIHNYLPKRRISDVEFKEADHPRGNPQNAGQFSSTSGGGSTKTSSESLKSNVTKLRPEIEQQLASAFGSGRTVTELKADIELAVTSAQKALSEKPELAQVLSGNEAVYLASYTGSCCYWDLNAGLRSGELSPAQAQYKEIVSTALTKLPAKPGRVVRGTNLSPEILKQYQEGIVLEERAFTSTSSSDDVFLDRNPRFIIEGKSGRDVSSFAKYPAEAEVLFPAGTKFKVMRVEKVSTGGSTANIYLKEV